MKMEIKVNDKVQWWGFKGDEQILFAGVVESISEFNGKKTSLMTYLIIAIMIAVISCLVDKGN